jgi:molecular chaperone DnaK
LVAKTSISLSLPKRAQEENSIDLTGDRTAIQRVRWAAEKAKIELSSAQQTEINLFFITTDASNRSQFEALVQPLVQRTVEPCKKSLTDVSRPARSTTLFLLVV